jgi:hypothetical protein
LVITPHSIITVDTGYHYRLADGIQVYEDTIWWHTHPTGRDVWNEDISSAAIGGAPVIYASGDRLSKAETNGVNSPPFSFGETIIKETYEDGVWTIRTYCYATCEAISP